MRASFDARIDAQGPEIGLDPTMRTTLNLDDALLREAQQITGMTEKSALVREGLRALIERESARRLARLGGSEPDLASIPRRRPVEPVDEP